MEQECSDTIPSDTVLGASGGLHHDDHLHPEQQVEGDSPVMPGDKQEEPHLSPRTRQVDRQDDSNSNGSSACSSILQKSTTVEEQSPDHLGVLRRHSSPYSKCEGGVRMVGSGATEMEWKTDTSTPPRSHDRDGCIPIGMGCNSRRCEHGRFVVRDRAKTTSIAWRCWEQLWQSRAMQRA